MLLGLDAGIWIVLGIYFAGILALGWWSKRGIHDQEGYLLGNRQFGVKMMIMHAFGAGTHPGDAAGVTSKTVSGGASGIWVSWMWIFGTPFYWLIAPVYRRMRCLTVADFYRQRYGQPATVLYVIIASVGMIFSTSSILLATTRTVQGMMGKPVIIDGFDPWFFGILFSSTAIFAVYSFWGGIVAAIRTDMIQGLMIIALSFIAIPTALGLVGGLEGMRDTLQNAAQTKDANYLSLFNPQAFSIWTVLVLCINAPFSIMAQPHIMPISAAGRTEWEGRMGFAGGNLLKRFCTMGWCLLGLCWLAYLINSKAIIDPGAADAAFGDSIRYFFSSEFQGALAAPLQGLMLACVMAAAMSSGDAIQVTVAGLFSENIYRVHINPEATEQQALRMTRLAGIVIVVLSVIVAILMRDSVVKTILDFFNITALIGISAVMGVLWRRMNATGMFASALVATAAFLFTRYYLVDSSRAITTIVPLASGIIGGVVGSLLTAPPPAEVVDKFYTKIYVPIGEEERLELSLDEVVPPEQRLTTACGLFIVKPSRQSWVGFLVTLAICLACVGCMVLLLRA